MLEQERDEHLREEASRAGVSIGELIRRALAKHYAQQDQHEALLTALDASAGAWADLDVDGEQFVERLRPGLEARWTDGQRG